MNGHDTQHSHVYERPIAESGDDAPALIARAVTAGARVLDVGCGSGALGRFLRERKACECDGLTHNPEELEIARSSYRRVELVDLESRPASEAFSGTFYDFVVCADVLEHLRNCEEVLSDLARLLAPEGSLLVSVPNVCYVGVLASMLQGRFAQTREGVLDATHVRFFDLAALKVLATGCGLAVVAVDRVIRQPAETEFRFLDFELMPPAQKTWLLNAPEALTYEYVLTLRKKAECSDRESESRRSAPAYSPVAIAASFETQVFFDYGQGVSEIDSARRVSPVGAPVAFELSGRAASDLAGIRFDFVDRPGLFEVHQVDIATPNRGVLWSWRGDWSAAYQLSGLEILAERGVHGGRLLLATNDEPIMLVPFEAPLDLGGETPVVAFRMVGPQAYSRAAFQWAEEKYGDSIRQATEVQTRLASALATVELALNQAEVDKRHLGEYIKRLETDLGELRVAHHALLTSPFHRVLARLRWLFGRLNRRSQS